MPFEDGIKTVSGSVCNIRDGAPKVGLESWQVTLPASLDGYSAIGCNVGNANLLVNNIEDGLTGGITYTKNADGSISCSGTVSNINSTRIIATNVKMPVGSYFFHGADTSIRMRCTIYDKDGTYTARNDTGNGVTVSVSATTDYLEFRILARTLNEVVNTTVYPQFEVGSSASSYVKANTTTAAASLGRTIYGGTADIVNGTGTDGYGYIVFDGSSDETWGGYSAYNGYYIDISDMKSGTRQDGVCNQLTCSKSTAQGQTNAFWLGAGNKMFYVIGVYDSMGNTLEAFKTYLSNNPLILVYPLATETDFTFDAITPTPETPLGVSNWWSVGTSEISYHDNAHGFASVTVTKQAPDQADEVKTAYLHKVIFGGLVDVVQGKAEPKNWIDDNLSNLEQGTINGNTGEDESANNRVRSINVIPFPYDEIASSYRWTFPDGYKAAIRPFDANGNYVSLPSWSLGFVTSLPQNLIGQGIVAMKFVLAKNDNSAITPDDMKNIGYLLEKGSTATSYAPFFAPFSFPPISMETDEGENTLYADEGNSAIVYRKEST